MRPLRSTKRRSPYEARLELWLQGASLPAAVRECTFAKADGRRWRIDFAWPDYRVGVEVDGGGRLVRWQTNPRTGRSQPVAVGQHGTSTDYEKLNYCALKGWRILRFTPDMLKRPDEVLGTIAGVLIAAGWSSMAPRTDGSAPRR